MMFLFIQIFIGVILNKFCFCETTLHTDSLMKEVLDIKQSVIDLKQKTKMFDVDSFLSLHTLLASTDSNIKNVQQKSIIWDTLSNQIPLLSSKLDVITKNQDKMVDDLNSKIDLIAVKINDISTLINVIQNMFKEVNNKLEENKKCNVNSDPVSNAMTTNRAITPEESLDSLILLNNIDFAFCNLNENLTGLFRFYTKFTNLIEGTRDFGPRLCEKGWLVIQKRDSFEVQENFNRSWSDYKHGFGDLRTEFWFGNDFLSKLSEKNNLKLRVEFDNFDGNEVWAEYDTFKVGSESDTYKLTIDNYTGTAYDLFSSYSNLKFSTFDKQASGTCAVSSGSGWWFENCYRINLNGIYYKNDTSSRYKGINWNNWSGMNFLKGCRMMVKPNGHFTQFSDLTYKRYNY